MNNKLPIRPIFLEALALPYKHYRALLKVGLPAIIASLLVALVEYFFTENNAVNIPFTIFLPLMLFNGTAFIMAIIGCHSLFLLGPSNMNTKRLVNWTGNEFHYFYWWIFVGFGAFFLIIPIMFVIMPFVDSIITINSDIPSAFNFVTLLSSLPIYYVISRWSLVFPSAAIGIHRVSLTWSWRLSKSNGWRLTLLIGFLPIIADALFSLFHIDDSLLLNLFITLAWLLIGVIEVGLLSLSYRFLVANENNDESNME